MRLVSVPSCCDTVYHTSDKSVNKLFATRNTLYYKTCDMPRKVEEIAVKKSSEKNGPSLSFRPTDRVLKLLEDAQMATGSDRSHLILKCIEQGLDKVVRAEVERQLKEAQERADRLKGK